MPNLHHNPSILTGDEDNDADIFEFDRKLNEISSKINDTMQRINTHYPEKINENPAEEDAEKP